MELIIAGLIFLTGSLATEVTGWGLKNIWLNVLVPIITNAANAHISLGDTWKLEHVGEPTGEKSLAEEWKTSITLRQLGGRISGSARSVCILGNVGKIIHYRVAGTFSNSVLNISFHQEGAATRHCSTFLLQLVGDGNSLEGTRTFFGKNANRIRAIECRLTREKLQHSACEVA